MFWALSIPGTFRNSEKCREIRARRWYNLFVDDKPLIETNPYLRDPEQYEKSLFINVTTSTAVELGKVPASMIRALKNKKRPLFINLNFGL